MKEIMFNGEMVKQIHAGNKTATRRIVDLDIINNCDIDVDGTLLEYENDCGDFIDPIELCKYKIGDILYVRETAMIQSMKASNDSVKMLFKNGELHSFKVPTVEYQRLLKYADSNKFLSPYWLTKAEVILYLKVIDVRVERLQDITPSQVIKEGIKGNESEGLELRDKFEDLWNSTIKKTDLDQCGWDANPWVYAIEFERCEKEVE